MKASMYAIMYMCKYVFKYVLSLYLCITQVRIYVSMQVRIYVVMQIYIYVVSIDVGMLVGIFKCISMRMYVYLHAFLYEAPPHETECVCVYVSVCVLCVWAGEWCTVCLTMKGSRRK